VRKYDAADDDDNSNPTKHGGANDIDQTDSTKPGIADGVEQTNSTKHGSTDDVDHTDSTENVADEEPNSEPTGITVIAVHPAEADAHKEDSEDPYFTRWSQNQLYSDSRGSDIKVCLHQDVDCVECHPQDPDSSSEPELSISFTDRISSHLLYYRIVVTYAMPPSVEVQYPVCHWKIKLRHIDGISLLEFEDSKGEAHVKFTGTPEASEDALKVLNYLTGEKCLHTYDGILAGLVA
jgi:hypothetical protein